MDEYLGEVPLPSPEAIYLPYSLVGVARHWYTLSMESMTDRNVNDIPAAERQAIEALLGRSLDADQQVFIMAYTPNAVPSQAVRDAARASLQRTFDKIDEYAKAHGVTPEEADAALDEAMGQVRPRHG